MNRPRIITKEKAELILQEVGLNLFDKPVKYLINRLSGLDKSKSALKAGYADPHHTIRIENTDAYKKAAASISDKLPTTEKLATEHTKVIEQDTDLSSKNRAIDMAYKLKDLYPREEGELDVGGVKITVTKKGGSE